MEAALEPRRVRPRGVAALLASAGFVVLIVGVTYFAILVLATHFAAPEDRYAAFRELGLFLSGAGQPWFRDARVYGAVSLLLALASILFGPHPLARITLPVALLIYCVVHLYGNELRDLLLEWALRSAHGG